VTFLGSTISSGKVVRSYVQYCHQDLFARPRPRPFLQDQDFCLTTGNTLSQKWQNIYMPTIRPTCTVYVKKVEQMSRLANSHSLLVYNNNSIVNDFNCFVTCVTSLFRFAVIHLDSIKSHNTLSLIDALCGCIKVPPWIKILSTGAEVLDTCIQILAYFRIRN